MQRTPLLILAASAVLCLAPSSAVGRTGDGGIEALARSLVELREAAGLSVSPSGRWAAYEVRRADPEANTYHAHWEVIDLARRGAPVTVAAGGEMPFGVVPRNRRPMAVWVTLAARWSPDENRIAFLRREGGRTQIWRARVDDEHAEQVTDDAGDVTDLVWSADGRALIYDAGPSRAALRQAFERERAQGFLLDDRFDPISSWEPVRTNGEVPDPPCCRVIDLATHAVRDASADEIARFRSTRPRPGYREAPGMAHMWTALRHGDPARLEALTGEPDHVRWRTLFADGAAALFALADPSLQGSTAPVRLHARSSATSAFSPCADSHCAGWIINAWRTADGDIAFLRREGWAYTTFAFYRWRPSTGAVRRLIATHDIWYDCRQAHERLVCFTEGSLAPQTLVSLDLDSGRVTELVNLNPDFDRTRLASAERLEWRSPLGNPDFSYFVRPRQRRPPGGFPLVIVHYRARGFLRGGSGDFSPVQAYAAAGIAVLAVDRPEDWSLTDRIADENEVERQNFHGARLRRDIFGALQTGIDILVRRGEVDPDRIGISGVSDGSASTGFAIAHTSRFRAASISGGGWEPLHFYLSSPRQRAFYTMLGLGAPGTADDLNWDELSVARNAARITTPLLIQSADAELAMAVEPMVALQMNNRPVEAYVFSNEDHVIWQPAHRLSMYRRNLDWFRFWLQDYEDPSPEKMAQYERWRAMRAQAQ